MLSSSCLCTQLLSVWVEEIAVAATLHTENHNSDFNETFSLEHYSVGTTERIFLLADWKCTNSDSSITTETCGGEMRICWLCWSLLCDKDMNSLCKVTSGCQSFNTASEDHREGDQSLTYIRDQWRQHATTDFLTTCCSRWAFSELKHF